MLSLLLDIVLKILKFLILLLETHGVQTGESQAMLILQSNLVMVFAV